MKKEKQRIERETVQEIVKSLEEALYEAASEWEPVGFLPCTMLQQLAGDPAMNQTVWDIIHNSLRIEFIEEDVSHIC